MDSTDPLRRLEAARFRCTRVPPRARFPQADGSVLVVVNKFERRALDLHLMVEGLSLAEFRGLLRERTRRYWGRRRVPDGHGGEEGWGDYFLGRMVQDLAGDEGPGFSRMADLARVVLAATTRPYHLALVTTVLAGGLGLGLVATRRGPLEVRADGSARWVKSKLFVGRPSP